MNYKRLRKLAFTAMLSAVGFNLTGIAAAKEPRMLRGLKKAAAQLAQKQGKRKLTPNCVNFSGNWAGICVDNDGRQENIELVIEQHDCSTIDMDGFTFDINGLNTIASSPNPNAEFPVPIGGAISMNWNDAQTRLYGSIGANLGGWFVFVSTEETWLEGDTLRRKDTASYTLDPTGVPSPTQMVMDDCTMTRR